MALSIRYYRCNICGYMLMMSRDPGHEMICCGHKMNELHQKPPKTPYTSKYATSMGELT